MKKTEKISRTIEEAVKNMPFFSIENLPVIYKNKEYLKILLSRMRARNKLIRLKRGIYVSREYIDGLKAKGGISDYLEFIAGKLYEPSYLSAEYVLSEYGVLSEAVFGYVLVSTNKTNRIKNDIGGVLFSYHNIKPELFTGYRIIKKGEFMIFKAGLAKALFDFLYFRKNFLINKETARALRLNWDNIKKKDLKELKKYISKARNKKMLDIYNWLAEAYE